MARLKAIKKIGRPAKGRQTMLINRTVQLRDLKPITRKSIFAGDLNTPRSSVEFPKTDEPTGTVSPGGTI